MASLDTKLEALLIKYKDLKEAFRAYKDENSLEHKKRVDEILSVMKMPGQKGDKGDKGEQGERGKDGVAGKDGKDGEDGATIVSSWVAADNHLMFEMSDGRQIDAGDLNLPESSSQFVNVTQKIVSGMGGGDRQEVFIGEPAVAPDYPAIILAENVVDGQTVFEFKVNVP